MTWDAKKLRLQQLIEQDTGIERVRRGGLDNFAQKRAREIRAEVDPRSQDTPTHRGWQLGDPIEPDTWDSYWEDLPSWVTMFGENLTWNYLHKDSVKAAAEGWKNSPPHWANETNPNFKRMGLGITRLILPGDESNPLAWRWYYVAIYTN